MKNIFGVTVLVLIVLGIGFAGSANAANATWDGDTSANWDDSGNWDAWSPGSGEEIFLNNAGGNDPTNMNWTGACRNLDINFADNAVDMTGTGTLTLGLGGSATIDGDQGSAYSIAFNIAISGTSSLNFDTAGLGDSVTFSGVLSGATSGRVTLQGDSYGSNAPVNRLIVTGANTYTGPTTITRTVEINTIGNVGAGASSLGAPTTVANGTITFGHSSRLRYNSATDGSTDRDIIATMSFSIESGVGAGILTWNGDVLAQNMTSGTQRYFSLRGDGDGVFAGDILASTGTARRGVCKGGTSGATDNGTWTLSGNNTYYGTTDVNDGTLVLAGTYTGGQDSTHTLAFLDIDNSGDVELTGIAWFNDLLFESGVADGQLSFEDTDAVLYILQSNYSESDANTDITNSDIIKDGSLGNWVVGTYDLSGTNFTSISVVPEPTTMALLAIGAAGLLIKRRRRRRTA